MKLAKQHKVDIASVVGTGPFEWITSVDVEATVRISLSKSINIIMVSPAIAAVAPAPVAAVAPKAVVSPTPPPILRSMVAKRSHGITEASKAARHQRSQVRERQGLARSQ